MQRVAGATVSVVAGVLLSLVTDESSQPSASAVRVLVFVVVIAGLYLALTTEWAVKRWPPLRRIPGAKEPGVRQSSTRETVGYRLRGGSAVTGTRHHISGKDVTVDADEGSVVDVDGLDAD